MTEHYEYDADKQINDYQKRLADAGLHAAKELGSFYDVAFKHFGGNGQKLNEEALKQIKSLQEKKIELREDGIIKLGLFDLKPFGLAEEQIKQRRQEINEEVKLHSNIKNAEIALETAKRALKNYQRMQDAALHAHKELGIYYQDAVEALGSAETVNLKAREQLDALEEQGVVLRENGLIKLGLLDIEGLGLPKELADKRRRVIRELSGQFDEIEEPAAVVGGAPDTEVQGGGKHIDAVSRFQIPNNEKAAGF